MGRKRNGSATSAVTSRGALEQRETLSLEDCWALEEKAIEQIAVLGKCLRTVVLALPQTSKRARREAIEASAGLRAALRLALEDEQSVFLRWSQLALQPDLFEPAPRSEGAPATQ